MSMLILMRIQTMKVPKDVNVLQLQEVGKEWIHLYERARVQTKLLLPEELPFLDDNCKLPAVIQKKEVDESIGENSTEIYKDVTV